MMDNTPGSVFSSADSGGHSMFLNRKLISSEVPSGKIKSAAMRVRTSLRRVRDISEKQGQE